MSRYKATARNITFGFLAHFKAKIGTGNLGGRPKVYSRAQRELAMKLLAEGLSYRKVEESTGISKSTFIREHRSHT